MNLELRIENVEKEIKAIKDRNKKVEGDKAWETSLFRIGLICTSTYFFAAIFLRIIGSENYLINAFVPVIAYFLSTQSMPFIKKWWIENKFK
ncbi:hypothetical protein HYW54_03505 [Candidatus Gottesmanbacteria bacterium]|nr:hypothetical protein [Candidatus Gottesmanbacteria bacterium]